MKIAFKKKYYCPVCGRLRVIKKSEVQGIAERILESPYHATSIFCNSKPNLHSTCKNLILVKGIIKDE